MIHGRSLPFGRVEKERSSSRVQVSTRRRAQSLPGWLRFCLHLCCDVSQSQEEIDNAGICCVGGCKCERRMWRRETTPRERGDVGESSSWPGICEPELNRRGNSSLGKEHEERTHRFHGYLGYKSQEIVY